MNMCNQAAGALTATLTPWIAAHFGWTSAFLVAAALCFIGALAWLAVNPEHQLSRTNVPRV
jgi:ACS family glucarate transporter-like MFS transporter